MLASVEVWLYFSWRDFKYRASEVIVSSPDGYRHIRIELVIERFVVFFDSLDDLYILVLRKRLEDTLNRQLFPPCG